MNRLFGRLLKLKHIMKSILFALCVFVARADPERPHLAQAWTALSTGDGVQGQTGVEHYIYERDVDEKNGINGHIWDYGAPCKKMEVDAGFHYPDPDIVSGTYYLKCDAVDCCYGGDQQGEPADVKKWDIDTPGLFKKVKFIAFNDTTELNDNPVKQAEHWRDTDFGKVTYDHYITRNNADIISHRIDYQAPPAVPPGSILYGNFTVIHNKTAFRKMFSLPDACKPGNLLPCDSGIVAKWERAYFKHSFATKSTKSSLVV